MISRLTQFLKRRRPVEPLGVKLAKLEAWLEQADEMRRCAQARGEWDEACDWRDRMNEYRDRQWWLMENWT